MLHFRNALLPNICSKYFKSPKSDGELKKYQKNTNSDHLRYGEIQFVKSDDFVCSVSKKPYVIVPKDYDPDEQRFFPNIIAALKLKLPETLFQVPVSLEIVEPTKDELLEPIAG